MIDWNKSAELNVMSIEDLKAYFDKYQHSHKHIVRICDKCDNNQNIPFGGHSDLCHACSVLTEEYRKKRSENTTKQWSAQEARDAQSERTIQFNIGHPEVREDARLKSIEHWSSQSARDAMSEIKKNSEAAKVAVENMRGGNDIVNHHYLYDDADLSKNAIQMTRSEHTAMHRRMQLDGYKVQHINSATDDNGLWGYR